MNKRDAQQHLVAYKDNQREKEYALQHGVLSNFKAKYLEKIPLGNGKFRYIYEETKDKVSSAAKNVANSIKTAVNPGAMTENEKSIRSSTNQARADVKKQQEANARKAALEENNRRATTNAQSPNAADARMQFAKQAVAENQNKADYLNKQKNAKPTGADRTDKIESQRDDANGRTESKEADARKAALEEINKRSVEKAKESSLKSRAIRDILGDDYSESGNTMTTGENSKIGKLINDRIKNASDEAKRNIKSAVDGGIIAESSKNSIMKKYHELETHTYENKIEYGHRDPETHEFVLDYMESKKHPGDDGKLLTTSEKYKNQYMKEMLGVMNLSRYGDFEIKNGKVIAKNSDGTDASKEQLYLAKVLDERLSEMYEKAISGN